jgi:hypothetical protein
MNLEYKDIFIEGSYALAQNPYPKMFGRVGFIYEKPNACRE